VRSSSSKEYTGVTLVPGQVSSLNTYGIFGPSASLTGTKQPGHIQGDRQAALPLASLHTVEDARNLNADHVLPVHNTMPHYSRYQPPRVDESPFSSDAEIYPSGGVALSGSDDSMSSSTQHQTHTFAQLAAERGIREWNNGVFDNRWLLQPDEMWKNEASRKSVLTISPERQPLDRNFSRAVIPTTRFAEPSHGSAAQQETIDDLNRQVEELKNQLRGHSMSNEHDVAPIGGERRNVVPSTKTYGQFSDIMSQQKE